MVSGPMIGIIKIISLSSLGVWLAFDNLTQ